MIAVLDRRSGRTGGSGPTCANATSSRTVDDWVTC